VQEENQRVARKRKYKRKKKKTSENNKNETSVADLKLVNKILTLIQKDKIEEVESQLQKCGQKWVNMANKKGETPYVAYILIITIL
jgi:hypothetical protein